MSEKRTDNVRIINEFLIDLLGVLVPGVIFLFSVIVSIIIPMFLVYFQQETGNTNGCTECATKTDLLVSNVFHGWFWFVIFFTFLILAYAIGNIFYRLDIKDVDKLGFSGEKRKHYNEKIKRYNNKKEIVKLHENKEFIDEYFGLLSYQLSKNDKDKIERNGKEKYKVWGCLKTDLKEKLKKEDIDIEQINHIAWLLYHNESIIDKDGNVDDKVFESIKKEEKDGQEKILSDFLIEKYIMYYEKKYKNISDHYPNHIALGWYLLFCLRSETACDSKENCQFPYEYYDVYLDKRGEGHLNEYTSWCQNKNTRTKNAINQLKIEIQIKSKENYNIIVKNEAHIRMASSSYRVANIIWKFISTGSIVLLLVYYFTNGFTFPKCITLALPIMICLLSWFIRHSVIRFIHYQRLREIFFVLQIYDYIIRNANFSKPWAKKN